jgi:hypothetical protein
MRSASPPIDRTTRPGRPGILVPCTHLLLIATMVQGITPDFNDLASSRALQLLSGAILPARFFRDGGAPHVEAGATIGIPDSARIECEAEPASEVGFLPAAAIDGGPRSGALDAPRPRGNRGKSDRLIHLLCHLMC